MKIQKSGTKNNNCFEFISDDTKNLDKNTAFVVDDNNKKYLKIAKDLQAKGECAGILCIDDIELIFANNLQIIAITGTNGKTTTSAIIAFILQNLGHKVALLGTRGLFVDGHFLHTTGFTTPFSLELYHIVDMLSASGVRFLVMEASSHAIAQRRLGNLKPFIKVLTNITTDHLDYHKTLEDYQAVKIGFFDDKSINIINKDIPLYASIKPQNMTYSLKNGADFYFNGRDVCYLDFVVPLFAKLLGEFNSYNLLAAIASSFIANDKKDFAKIVELAGEFSGVSGRMEIINQRPLIVVDFAHTPDGMSKVLEIFPKDRVKVVFGCGGNRDATKRAVMGAIATTGAKYTYITSDNPRDEDPLKIINEIVAGTKNCNFTTIIDREEAINAAIDGLSDDEILLILGKGDEDYLIIGKNKFYFSDKEVVLRKLSSMCSG